MIKKTLKNAIKSTSYYPIDESLSVFPSVGESQYEAFQSILAEIMKADPSPTKKSVKSPYELLCANQNIRLKSYVGELPKDIDPFFNTIYPLSVTETKGGVTPQTRTRTKRTRTHTGIKKATFKAKTNIKTKTKIKSESKSEYPKCAICFENKPETHYIGLCKKSATETIEIFDPYASVQIYDSQGFCQMFAFFLIFDPSGFEPVTQDKKIDVDTFNKLAHNSQHCFEKIYRILHLPENNNVLKKFEEDFTQLDMNYYGIKPGTTCAQYLHDFKQLNLDINAVKYYIYDQPLVKWKQGVPKESLWKSFHKTTENMPHYYVGDDPKKGQEIAAKSIYIPL
jgi:hypothetical protein